MTAIAGIVDFGSGIETDALCRALVLAQRGYGPDASGVGSVGPAHFGRALFHRFPEDRYDQQPVADRETRLLLAADARVDNRDELCRALGVGAIAARTLADSALMMLGWRRWGEALFSRLCGSWAMAVWDDADRRLVLARDPFGQCPLHVAFGPGWVAFASMPQALRLLPGVDGQPDLLSLAAFVADLPRKGRASYFRGIERIEPGHVLTVSDGATRYASYWAPAVREVDADDLVEAYRFHLDQAVESCLRGAGKSVAAHLSGGWDSAAVASSAAIQLAPSARVLAFTAAPPADYRGAVPNGRIADESGRAALVARAHANLDHIIVRDRPEPPTDLLADNDRLVGAPTGYVCNNSWWNSINRLASQESAILLTAEMGNHTLSAGGPMQLADLVRGGRLREWLGEARGLAAARSMRWTGILDQSFGPFVPFYDRLRPLLARNGRPGRGATLIEPSLRRALRDRIARHAYGAPPADSRAHRAAMLAEQDVGTFRKASLARFGIDERDPTCERRFAEFCLALPQSALLDRGVTRPLARAALADRLPAEILRARSRGLQMADWHRAIGVGQVAEILGRRGVDALLDRDAVGALLARWPAVGFDRPDVIRAYRMDLMRAVSAASFLDTYSRRAAPHDRRSGASIHDMSSIEESRPLPGREKQE